MDHNSLTGDPVEGFEKSKIPLTEIGGGKRHVSKLPFSRGIFEQISKRFYLHETLGRVISRGDSSALSNARARMKDETGLTHDAYGTKCSFEFNYSDFAKPPQQYTTAACQTIGRWI